MKLKGYVRLWFLLLLALSWEAFALNFNTFVSFWALLKENLPLFKDLNLNPSPGKTISVWYGWTGLGIMALTNLYILRKHWAPLRKYGKMPGWLDFHIFCGLTGPTFILFHTNFHVRGLVAISFWSMVISFSSGVVGRYFYLQLVRQKSDLEKEANASHDRLKSLVPGGSEGTVPIVLDRAMALAGVGNEKTGLWSALYSSVAGDVRLAMSGGSLGEGLPAEALPVVKSFARQKRRIAYLSQFQKIMGYWHAFHMPFAVFMYAVAVIHVTVALLFEVKS